MDDGVPVACHACGTVHDQATCLIGELEDDLHNAERELRKLRRRVGVLEDQRGRDLRADPAFADAKAVLLRWQSLCSPRAREPLSETRLKPCLERLHGGYDRQALETSVSGYARFPFLIRGRRSAFGYETDRFVEAEFIFRNPQNVDRGIAMSHADLLQMPTPAMVARVPWEHVWHENRRLIVAALSNRFGGDGFEAENGVDRLWPCPQCEARHHTQPGQEPLNLRLRGNLGEALVECFVCGLEDARLLKAILNADGLLR